MDSQPNEIILLIANNLDLIDRQYFSSINKRFYNLIDRVNKKTLEKLASLIFKFCNYNIYINSQELYYNIGTFKGRTVNTMDKTFWIELKRCSEGNYKIMLDSNYPDLKKHGIKYTYISYSFTLIGENIEKYGSTSPKEFFIELRDIIRKLNLEQSIDFHKIFDTLCFWKTDKRYLYNLTKSQKIEYNEMKDNLKNNMKYIKTINDVRYIYKQHIKR